VYWVPRERNAAADKLAKEALGKPCPTIGELHRVLSANSQERADRSLLVMREQTAGNLNPASPQTAIFLRQWLNAWGCRLQYPSDQGTDIFVDNLGAWWEEWKNLLPQDLLVLLQDKAIETIAESFASLVDRSAVTNGRSRRFGPTATAKILYAVRPETVTAWDERIAADIGGADGAAFGRHMLRARDWARTLDQEAKRLGIEDLPAYLGRSESSLAKVIDEWLYLTISRGK
jgi:hypothetical protein